MKIGSGSTSETLKCIVCKKETSNYDEISHAEMYLKIPICPDHFDKINIAESIGELMTVAKSILLTGVKS